MSMDGEQGWRERDGRRGESEGEAEGMAGEKAGEGKNIFAVLIFFVSLHFK